MFRRIWVLLAASALAALAVAAPAAAKTYRVAGKQIVTNEETGASIVRGGLVGTWDVTGFEPDADPATPLQGTGTELFTGCLNRGHGKSCKGDPKGTLSFSFEYWAVNDAAGALIWGACWHPITSGTGAFAGAQGVFTFVDSPTKKGVNTRYIGTITLPGKAARAGASRAPAC